MTLKTLSGVRVLDFGRYVAGPYCATLLGYLGAEVIRIERPEGGEDRYLHPLGREDAEGALIFHTGCNKRSLCLDPASEAGKEVVRRLAASADVVVANLPEATLARLGLDYASLTAIRPDIILVTQSTFGAVGPDAGKPGFDGVGQAMSGAMHMSGEPGRPAKAAAPYVDYSTALISAFGALAALMERARTGQGQHVEASLLRTAMSAFGTFLTEEAMLHLGRPPTGNRVQTSGPSDCFATLDGHVLIHVVGEGLFRRVARLIGAEQWLGDPRFVGDARRGAFRDVLCERVAQWCAPRSTADAVAAFEAAGVPVGPVLTPRQAIDSQHVAAAEWFREVAFPGLADPVKVADIPLAFSGMEAGVTDRPPLLGEHTDEILGELGYDAEAVAGLRASGAAGPRPQAAETR